MPYFFQCTIIHSGQCTDLPLIDGGSIDYDFEGFPERPFGTTATYNCTMGTLVGPSTRTCDNGEWTGTPPSCQDTGMQWVFKIMCITLCCYNIYKS